MQGMSLSLSHFMLKEFMFFAKAFQFFKKTGSPWEKQAEVKWVQQQQQQQCSSITSTTPHLQGCLVVAFVHHERVAL